MYGIRVIAASLLLICATVSLADDDRYLEISGSGYVEAVPDRLALSIQLVETRPTASEALALIDQRTKALIEALRKQAIDPKDWDSSAIVSRPHYEWRNNQRVYEGEQVSRTVRVTLKDTARYGALLAELTALSPQWISPPELSHSRQDALVDEAMAKAIERARERARNAAKASGVSLGKVLRVQEQGYAMPEAPFLQARMSADMASSNAAAVEVDFSKQRIQAQVTLRFAID